MQAALQFKIPWELSLDGVVRLLGNGKVQEGRSEDSDLHSTVACCAVLSWSTMQQRPPAVDPFDSGTVEAKQAIEPHVNQGLRLAIPKRGRGDKGKKKKKCQRRGAVGWTRVQVKL